MSSYQGQQLQHQHHHQLQHQLQLPPYIYPAALAAAAAAQDPHLYYYNCLGSGFGQGVRDAAIATATGTATGTGTGRATGPVVAPYGQLPTVPGWLIQSVINDMPHSTQHEVQIHNLAWRRLHLSKAKLKASSRTSALLAGFAMVAMVEVQLDKSNHVPEGLLISFAICTTLLVAVHMLALMISTCILPNIEAVSNMHSISAVTESPHEKMHYYIEAAWAFSTVFGILLFLCEIAILCWVKFTGYSDYAALSATIILIPVVILFVAFATHFYRKLVAHQSEMAEDGLRELEIMINQLDSGAVGEGQRSTNGPSIINV